MSESPLGRRAVIKGLAAAMGAAPLLAAGENVLSLRNPAIEFSVGLAGGKVARRTFHQRHAAELIELPLDDWQLELDGRQTVSPSSMTASVLRRTATDLELQYAGGPVSVRVAYHLPAARHYLRKQISVRCTAGSCRLFRADLDNWQGIPREWQSMKMDTLPYGSHPIYCDTLFAGVEFVAAFNEYSERGFTLRSRPGALAIGSNWTPLRSTIVGVTAPGEARYAFLDYLEDVRLAPARMVACYNSWWTLPTVVVQRDNLDLIRKLKSELHDRHGVFFDIITTDMGWSNPRTVWEIDRKQLPSGFDDIRGIVEGAGGKLGIWMSPSEVYPPVCDYEWMEAHGYTAIRRSGGKKERYALSLGDPKYRSETVAQLRRLIRENNLGHIKYDGFTAEEQVGHHGILPGPDSVEPLAEASLELLQASKAANPALVTEPTYMNSLSNYISPWILKYSDSIWGNSGGDCPLGLGPAPDYRESHTNAREYYIFSSLNEFWLPQNAVHYFDIIQCDEAGGFANHAAMAFGRGRFFVSTYINPKFMTEEDWGIYAGFLRWARKNQEILRNTTVVPSRVERGEPYAYAHWKGLRGIIAVRNPSNETREYQLELGRTRPPAGLRNAVCQTLYPHSRGVAAGIHPRSVLSLTLAPWELQFLEILPLEELSGPIALGGRWTREGTACRLVHDGISPAVESLTPDGKRTSVAIPLREIKPPTGRVLRRSAWRLPEEQWLTGKAGRVATAAYELTCEVIVPASCENAEVLILQQVAGQKFFPSRCQVTVNGRPSTTVDTNSSGHTGYYDHHPQWAQSRESDRQWTWYRCPVPAGRSEIQVKGAIAGPEPQVGIWAWGDYDCEKSAQVSQLLLPDPGLPSLNARRQRTGACLLPPASLL